MKSSLITLCLVGADAIRFKTSKIEESKPYFTGFTPEYHGFGGNGEYRDAYERKVPAAFSGD